MIRTGRGQTKYRIPIYAPPQERKNGNLVAHWVDKSGVSLNQPPFGQENPFVTTREAIAALKRIYPKAKKTNKLPPRGHRDDICYLVETEKPLETR